jgi:zinc transport system substrate-binding protein
MHTFRSGYIVLIGALLLFTAGCSTGTGTDTIADRIVVAVSILPQAEFVESVGREHVEVIVMIPPGASPASYEPAPEQMLDLARADMYVKVGSPLPFEQVYLSRLVDQNPDMRIVDSSAGIGIVDNDPHIWNSPSNVMVMTGHIAAGLSEVDPQNEDEYHKNAAEYIQQLAELDSEIKGILRESEGKAFMVFHPSWGYFSRDYGLVQIPIETEGKEPSAKELQELIQVAKSGNITVIFVSPQTSMASPQLIAQQINGEVVIADPLAPDFSANLRDVAIRIAKG